MVKYRIKHVDMVGYFAQVKRGFSQGWKTLGRHTTGVGEYPEDNLDHPLSLQGDAVLLAHKHADWINAKKGFTTYTEIIL